MKEIRYTERIKAAAPQLISLCISAKVRNGATPSALSELIGKECERIVDTYEMAEVNKRPAIAATRKAYKNLGKEPNRYRPSAEALCRRAVNKKGLYQVNTLVDLINLISMRSGYSIGGFDEDKIQGNMLTLGAGESGEEFHAIGRGLLNIENLPVYRDNVGGIGTPTSDEERTKLSEETTRLLMIINIYGSEMEEKEVADYTCRLLEKYASASQIEIRKFYVSE